MLSRHDLRCQIRASAVRTNSRKVHALLHPAAAASAAAGDGLAVKLDDLGVAVVYRLCYAEIFHVQRAKKPQTAPDLLRCPAGNFSKLSEIDITVQISFKIPGEEAGVVDQLA